MYSQPPAKTDSSRQYRLLIHIFIIITAILLVGWSGAQMEYDWRWGRIPRYFFVHADGEWISGPLLRGLITTLHLSWVAGIFTLLLGALIAAAASSAMPSLRLIARGYVNIMRGTPLLVQLYLLYFMLGNALSFDRFFAGACALAMFEAAFAAEIIRGGIAAVDTGQTDAGAALGLSRWHRWRLILLPQALPLILPPLANLLVSLIKHSSIVTIIAIADLTDAARNLISESFLTFEIWLTVGAVYVAICLPLARLITFWENKIRR